jgi:hypothetical protein
LQCNECNALKRCNDQLLPGSKSRGQGNPRTERRSQRRLWVRVYAIPIGCTQSGHTFNCDRLYQIAHRTGGNLKPMRKMKEMAEHFAHLAARGGRNLGRSVAKVLLADVSPSMSEPFDRATKIEALKFSILRFLEIEAKRQ